MACIDVGSVSGWGSNEPLWLEPFQSWSIQLIKDRKDELFYVYYYLVIYQTAFIQTIQHMWGKVL